MLLRLITQMNFALEMIESAFIQRRLKEIKEIAEMNDDDCDVKRSARLEIRLYNSKKHKTDNRQ